MLGWPLFPTSDAHNLRYRILDPEFDADDAWLAEARHAIETEGSVRVAKIFPEIDYCEGRAAYQHGLKINGPKPPEPVREPPYAPAPPPPERTIAERFALVPGVDPEVAAAAIAAFTDQVWAQGRQALFKRSWDLWRCACWIGPVRIGAREHVCETCGAPLSRLAEFG